jgi:hypothetical protein
MFEMREIPAYLPLLPEHKCSRYRAAIQTSDGSSTLNAMDTLDAQSRLDRADVAVAAFRANSGDILARWASVVRHLGRPPGRVCSRLPKAHLGRYARGTPDLRCVAALRDPDMGQKLRHLRVVLSHRLGADVLLPRAPGCGRPAGAAVGQRVPLAVLLHAGGTAGRPGADPVHRRHGTALGLADARPRPYGSRRRRLPSTLLRVPKQGWCSSEVATAAVSTQSGGLTWAEQRRPSATVEHRNYGGVPECAGCQNV